MTIKFKLILLLIILANAVGYAQGIMPNQATNYINYNAISKFQKPKNYVSDFEGLFSEKEIKELDSIISEYDKKTTNQICIVTIKEIYPYTNLKDFSLDLGNYWGVGDSIKDNGLVFSVSKNLRNMWIITGYGAETILTEEILNSILTNVIVPYFKKGDYFTGVKMGLLECMNKWGN